MAAVKLRVWLARLGLNDKGRTVAEEVQRQRVADFIADYRRLCEDIGPWQYAADLGAPVDADLRTIAYLAVWRDGPTLRVWEAVKAEDSIDLVILAALAGFEAHVERHPAEA